MNNLSIANCVKQNTFRIFFQLEQYNETFNNIDKSIFDDFEGLFQEPEKRSHWIPAEGRRKKSNASAMQGLLWGRTCNTVGA